MWPAAWLTKWSPGGALEFWLIAFGFFIVALFFSLRSRRKEYKAWNKVLKESRDNRKNKN